MVRRGRDSIGRVDDAWEPPVHIDNRVGRFLKDVFAYGVTKEAEFTMNPDTNILCNEIVSDQSSNGRSNEPSLPSLFISHKAISGQESSNRSYIKKKKKDEDEKKEVLTRIDALVDKITSQTKKDKLIKVKSSLIKAWDEPDESSSSDSKKIAP